MYLTGRGLFFVTLSKITFTVNPHTKPSPFSQRSTNTSSWSATTVITKLRGMFRFVYILFLYATTHLLEILCLKCGAPVVIGVPGKNSFCQPSAIGVSRSRLARHLPRGSWSAPRGLKRWPEFHFPPRYSAVQSTLRTKRSPGCLTKFYVQASTSPSSTSLLRLRCCNITPPPILGHACDPVRF